MVELGGIEPPSGKGDESVDTQAYGMSWFYLSSQPKTILRAANLIGRASCRSPG